MSTQTLIENSTASRRNILFGVFSVILLAVAFEPLRRLVQLCLAWNEADLSYIVMIPFISFALIYWDRRKVFLQPRTSIGPAAVLFALGVILYALGHRMAVTSEEQNYLSVMTAAVIALFYSGFLLFYGWPVFKAA